MPTPPKTSAAAIVTAARELLSEQGLDSLSMQNIAARAGVRAPSLYKHFADREAVLKAVEAAVAGDLAKAVASASTSRNDKDALREIAMAYRQFARDSAAEYGLMFDSRSNDHEAVKVDGPAMQPALDRLEALFEDQELALVRSRVLMAYLHGFVSMEAAGAFRSGGGVNGAFSVGVDLLLKKPKK